MRRPLAALAVLLAALTLTTACGSDGSDGSSGSTEPKVIKVTFDGDSMRRYLTALGTGDIDWPALLALVPHATRWIEFHRGQFAMPIFDRDWLKAQPDTTLDEYRALVAAALRHSRTDAPAPDQKDVFARLKPSIDWLRANG